MSSPEGPHDHTATALARRVACQLVEVMTGRRAAHRMRERLSGPVAGLLATLGGGKRALGPSARLLSVHACLTNSARVEASAVVGDADSVRALTLRLERERTEWLCTLLAVV